jgi:hypothetical protein
MGTAAASRSRRIVDGPRDDLFERSNAERMHVTWQTYDRREGRARPVDARRENRRDNPDCAGRRSGVARWQRADADDIQREAHHRMNRGMSCYGNLGNRVGFSLSQGNKCGRPHRPPVGQ